VGTGGAGANVGGVAGVPACGGIAGVGIGRGGEIAGGAIAGGGVVSGSGRDGTIAGGATWICGVCPTGCMGKEVATGDVIAGGNWNGCAGLLYCFKVASTADHS